MSSPDRPRRQTLITLVRAALDAMLDELIERLHAAGHTDIRPAHSRVFENLDPDGTRMTVLAERAQMTHPSMSELVTSLQRLGYVQRVPDPADGRARTVRFTPAGRTVQHLALAEIDAIETAWIRALGPSLGPEFIPSLARAVNARRDRAEPEIEADGRGNGDGARRRPATAVPRRSGRRP